MQDYNYKEKDELIIGYNLQFFASGESGADKTEEPTSKKLTDARKEGQVAKSKELTNGLSLFMFFYVLKIFIKFMGEELIKGFNLSFSNIGKMAKEDISTMQYQYIFNNVLLKILLICLPVFVISIIVDVAVNLFQVKWKVSTEPMRPKLSKINPISGFKRIFSSEKLVELVFSILKLGIILFVVYNRAKKDWHILVDLYDIGLEQAILLIGDIIFSIGIQISIIFVIIGVADYFYQKYKFKKDMMMTKQEVKDEYKESEGDPQVKSKIKAKMREASQRRMMQALPEADVVITNPTHYAAAIKYDKELADAPILIAKGADFLAKKIKDIAKENKIEIVENKPLARMLYFNVEIGDEVPPELYQMTAEVLAYVYGLKDN